MFGMPAAEIEVSRRYRDSLDMRITINANKSKWEVVWADYSTDSKQNEVDDANDNVRDALAYLATKGFANLRPILDTPATEKFIGEK